MVKIIVPPTIYIHSKTCITVLAATLATEGILTMEDTHIMEAILIVDTL